MEKDLKKELEELVNECGDENGRDIDTEKHLLELDKKYTKAEVTIKKPKIVDNG